MEWLDDTREPRPQPEGPWLQGDAQVPGSPGAQILEHKHTCGCWGGGHRAHIQATLTATSGCCTDSGDWTTHHNQLFTGEKQAEKLAICTRLL